jgi:hypothetical protein
MCAYTTLDWVIEVGGVDNVSCGGDGGVGGFLVAGGAAWDVVSVMTCGGACETVIESTAGGGWEIITVVVGIAPLPT